MVPNHIEDEDLISFLDGEIAADLQAEMQTHLESCWHCRSRLSGVERSIENFLQLRQEVLLPAELPPSAPALELFRKRLTTHQALSPSHSLLKVKISDIRQLYRRILNSLNIANYSLKRQLLLARVVAVVVLTSIVAGVILFSGRFNTVSARELLERSINAQAEQLSDVDQPVLHQRIQIRRQVNGSDETSSLTWEIWNDTVTSRAKLTSYGNQPAETSGLREMLRANGMNESRPISATSYKSWTDSLKAKTEEVSNGKTAEGLDVLTVNTTAPEPVPVGGFLQAGLSVRASDFHPIELRLRVKTADGNEEFDLIENNFEIVSLKDVNPQIFDEDSTAKTLTAGNPAPASPSASPSASPEEVVADTNGTGTQPNVATATAETEVEVLDLLHKVGADITEQISVTRTADGRLLVGGLVENDRRKLEILQALAPIANNPAIKIKVQTIAEATLALQKQNQQSGTGTIDRVEVQKGTIPADSDLRAYFSKSGDDVDAEIRRFSSSVINRSQSAVFQASALNRLANRFTSEQLKTLDAAARVKWLTLLKGYASAVRRETAALRGELEPVFGGMSAAGEGVSIASDDELIRSAGKLYGLAVAADRVVRSAFTLSNGNVSVSAVRNQQFRQNLGTIEKLAAAIERAH